MIFAVVPADVFGIGFDKGEKPSFLSPRPCVSLIWANSQLRIPRHGLSVQLRIAVHLRGDDAYQIVFGGKNIDSGDFAFVHHWFQCSHKTLGFLPFPVEINSDVYVI